MAPFYAYPGMFYEGFRGMRLLILFAVALSLAPFEASVTLACVRLLSASEVLRSSSPDSLSTALASLMSEGRMTCQYDSRLVQAGITNGESCGETDVLNMARAIYRFAGRSDLDLDLELNYPSRFREIYGYGARIGIKPDGGTARMDLVYLLGSLLRERAPEIKWTFENKGDERLKRTEIDPTNSAKYVPRLRPQDLHLEKNQLAFISIGTRGTLAQGHVVIGMDTTRSGVLHFSDPNAPNKISEVELAEDGMHGPAFIYGPLGWFEVMGIIKITLTR